MKIIINLKPAKRGTAVIGSRGVRLPKGSIQAGGTKVYITLGTSLENEAHYTISLKELLEAVIAANNDAETIQGNMFDFYDTNHTYK